ncbi:hypothetical protein H696_01581 [Fonticula alba]|uniref:TLC domain-containing protein n=1 Tax=Fonticula alba TaxID=691883 RepID=A0A058ZCS0_FONAL|nr:hypothetical protein H696_01581 [Fonticula alba]KCV72179.1 hypothetical protein H696_01581 [Fonticula alba]|eukprot:XP_009493757.1 hypothetical protein H696_01581 [Fonticula alba]
MTLPTVRSAAAALAADVVTTGPAWLAPYIPTVLLPFVHHKMMPPDLLSEIAFLKDGLLSGVYLCVSDIPMILLYTCIWAALFSGLRHLLFIPFAKKVLSRDKFFLPLTADESPQEGDVTRPDGSIVRFSNSEFSNAVHKFETACWKFFSFSALCLVGLLVCGKYPWLLRSIDWWNAYPSAIEPDVKQFYLFDLAYWLQTCFVLYHEPRLDDRMQMWVHHAVTIFLIVLSLSIGFYRVGVLVMVLHDLSDPFMEIAKLFVYVGRESISAVFFVAFTLAFFITRLVLFPGFVLRSTLLEASFFLKVGHGYVIFNCLLAILQALHVFWFYLIMKIVVRTLLGNPMSDIREEPSVASASGSTPVLEATDATPVAPIKGVPAAGSSTVPNAALNAAARSSAATPGKTQAKQRATRAN